MLASERAPGRVPRYRTPTPSSSYFFVQFCFKLAAFPSRHRSNAGSPAVDSFFRRVCDEYFRPGSFPDDGGGRDGNRDGDDHALGGVAESKGSGVDEPESPEGDGEDVRGISDSGVGGGGESDVLREAMMRADFVNSLNAFNQLEVRGFFPVLREVAVSRCERGRGKEGGMWFAIIFLE